MRQLKAFGLVGVLLLAGSLSLRADVWDVGTATDNVPAQTRNELNHGSDQIHDLNAAGTPLGFDEDWFRLTSEPYSSYTILVDSGTAEVILGNGSTSRRDFADPNTNLQSSFGGTSDLSQTLSFQNTTAEPVSSYLRVGFGCTSCDANDQYRVRMFDTTYLIPRFNNANSQVTVLLLQNSLGGTPVFWTAYYWSVTGTLLAQVPGTLPAHQTAVVNLSTIPALQGQTGAITISHNAGYGGLAAKAVALEPATGFSFDTLGTYRHR